MSDISRHQLPPVRIAADGGIDIDSYMRAARRERMVAQREAFSAAVHWLRGLFGALSASPRHERLG